jgi:hypothetical protein
VAKAAGKKLMFKDWGACYYNTENNNFPTSGVLATATWNVNIKNWAAQITAAGVPRLYWQVLLHHQIGAAWTKPDGFVSLTGQDQTWSSVVKLRVNGAAGNRMTASGQLAGGLSKRDRGCTVIDHSS